MYVTRKKSNKPKRALIFKSQGVDGIPCKDCRRRGKECTVPPSRRKRRTTVTSQISAPIENRLARMEALLQNAVTTTPSAPKTIPTGNSEKLDGDRVSSIPTTASHSDTISEIIVSGREDFETANRLRRSEKAIGNSWENLPRETYLAASQSFALGHSNGFSEGLSHASLSPEQPRNSGTTYPENVNSLDSEEGVIQLQNVNWEHHGPSSWVSVCSPPGLKWVCERMGTNEFIDSAKLLVHTWSSRLTMKTHPVTAQRRPEPDATTAWAYTLGMNFLSRPINR